MRSKTDLTRGINHYWAEPDKHKNLTNETKYVYNISEGSVRPYHKREVQDDASEALQSVARLQLMPCFTVGRTELKLGSLR